MAVRTVGVDLGGTKCLAVAYEDGRVVDERRVATPVGEVALLDTIAGVAAEVEGPAGVAGVGVGVPGLVDRQGVLRFAPNLPGVADFPIGPELSTRLGVPVRVDNDATCATWGERQAGAARGYDDVLLVALGTGIGGGIVADGMLVRGANGFSGEVGHMIVDPDGPPCPCGKRGCWERFASGSGLARLGREAAEAGKGARTVELAGGAFTDVRGQHVGVAAREGDRQALAVLDDFGWWVALGLSNLASIFDPQAIVLGGGLVEMGELLLGPVRKAFPDLLTGGAHRPPVDILPAALGEHAGAIGAAALFDLPREIARSRPL